MTAVMWYTVFGGVIVLVVLIAAFKSGKPISSLSTSALQGVCALAAVNVSSVLTGVTLGVTSFSLTVCGVLGLPGVIGMLVLQSMFTMAS